MSQRQHRHVPYSALFTGPTASLPPTGTTDFMKYQTGLGCWQGLTCMTWHGFKVHGRPPHPPPPQPPQPHTPTPPPTHPPTPTPTHPPTPPPTPQLQVVSAEYAAIQSSLNAELNVETCSIHNRKKGAPQPPCEQKHSVRVCGTSLKTPAKSYNTGAI